MTKKKLNCDQLLFISPTIVFAQCFLSLSLSLSLLSISFSLLSLSLSSFYFLSLLSFFLSTSHRLKLSKLITLFILLIFFSKWQFKRVSRCDGSLESFPAWRRLEKICILSEKQAPHYHQISKTGWEIRYRKNISSNCRCLVRQIQLGCLLL